MTNPFEAFASFPEAAGLYDPAAEKDACGMAFVSSLRAEFSHEVIEKALTALRAMEHRGAVGADEGTGDGAGILVAMPDRFLRASVSFELPQPGRYTAGTVFLPDSDDAEAEAIAGLERLVAEEGLTLLGWRDVPTRPELIGDLARSAMPRFKQLFVSGTPLEEGSELGESLEAKAFRVRKRAQNTLGVYFPSFSNTTLVYKGMLTTAQVGEFFPDLQDARFESVFGIVHSRFSTNTFPSWPLAQPFRHIAHNGEINTIKGNRNWMRARQGKMASPVLGQIPEELFPVCTPGASDSASFDEVVELLTLSGRSLPHALLMMVPEAWQHQQDIPEEKKAFYRYHSMLMEPWDGPAAISFTDGRLVGALLDRNGLRPARYWKTSDGFLVLASEAGVLPIPAEQVVERGRVKPGEIFVVDTARGVVIPDEEVKAELYAKEDWAAHVRDQLTRLEDLPELEHVVSPYESIVRRQQVFGYTREELKILLAPMAATGAEPLGAMGTDTPIAVLAKRPRLLFDYFTQSFAQVTNPPLDAIREEVVTSLDTSVGSEGNLLTPHPVPNPQISLDFPVIDNDQLAKIVALHGPDMAKKTLVVRGLYHVGGGEDELRSRVKEICEKVAAAVNRGIEAVVLSDRDSSAQWAPIPSLLLLSAVHHHLIRSANRTQTSLIVEAGDVREVHHAAVLIGYGASAINPYLAMETVEDMVRRGRIEVAAPGFTGQQAVANLLKALGKGVLKIMSKMGISTVSSYMGAQTFEAVGLSRALVDEFFHGTPTKISGIGLDTVAAETAARHARAYPEDGNAQPFRELEDGGEYQYRREGPPHLFSPENIFTLQHSTRQGRFDLFQRYSSSVNEQSAELKTLRGLFEFASDREPILLEQVEPAENILTRFSTGAMSYGSISKEAHETLAIAMNSIGGKSNTGEGGEDVERLLDPERRSAIKQIASGRFGVTSMYLTHADDIQIKLAQGAKPGEGGQLMGRKVYPWVAATRHSTPGVSLISPPPHHDIYSIEDLAQLIYDCKRAHPSARVHVKLVSESGIGTVAAGVTKAKADVVLVSGHDGGTGASPLNSLKHAGTPWELGLAETQQTLLFNGLRERVVVQVDGQLKTGRDVVIAALLGAEEFGFATAPLVVSGCIMMRVCHLDTCPVGVATQNPTLRARYTGKAEHVANFFRYIAEEVRQLLAELGFATLEEAIGQVGALRVDRAVEHYKAEGLDLAPLLTAPDVRPGQALHSTTVQDHEIAAHYDQRLLEAFDPVLSGGSEDPSLRTMPSAPVVFRGEVVNVDRSVGTLLGHYVTKAFGEDLPEASQQVILTGTAGQSLGAFLPKGVQISLTGDSNDYVGKGLSGGRIAVTAAGAPGFVPEENVVIGNVTGYGATSGELFVNGRAGERFLVRNSGASAVVEGIGDHGCEYMTGGTAVVLGSTGKNFAAGFSGGTVYLLDADLTRFNAEALEELTVTELADPQAPEAARLHELVSAHAEHTGSALAQRLLADWPAALARFTHAVPTHYSRVRLVMADAAQAGTDPEDPQLWVKILEVSNG